MQKKFLVFLVIIIILSVIILIGNKILINSKHNQQQETSQENEYKLVSEIKNAGVDVTFLVRVDGILYGKSYAMLDYSKPDDDNKIGVVDKLIDSIYIPKLDFETNNKELLNSEVFEGRKGYNIVLYYNNEYVLFEAIQGK